MLLMHISIVNDGYVPVYYLSKALLSCVILTNTAVLLIACFYRLSLAFIFKQSLLVYNSSWSQYLREEYSPVELTVSISFKIALVRASLKPTNDAISFVLAPL